MTARRGHARQVVVVVALAVVAGATRLDEALGLLDWRADVNASRSYLDRTYADDGLVVESRRVVEDARLLMPEDATYRILIGASEAGVRFRDVAPDFLRYFLLPRRESDDATYVFCLDCDVAALGEDFEVLSEEGGIVFGRQRE
jgi:hypothetical protein